MRILVGVTGIAIGGCAFIAAVDMASQTCNSAMTGTQWETGLRRMVKVDILPIARVVAVGTVTSHLSGVYVFMTSGTVRWCIFKKSILMTTFTGNIGVLAQQLERGF